MGHGPPLNTQNTKISCKVFWTGFCSWVFNDTIPTGSLLWYLGVTSITITMGIELSRHGEPRPFTYSTVLPCYNSVTMPLKASQGSVNHGKAATEWVITGITAKFLCCSTYSLVTTLCTLSDHKDRISICIYWQFKWCKVLKIHIQ
jgi:hypothetical protein